MALADLISGHTYLLAAVGITLSILGSLYSYFLARPSFPKNSPPLTHRAFPIIGSIHFFTQRWDFIRESAAHMPSGNFSFYAGRYPIINLDGRKEANRKIFFESKSLDFGKGYATLLGGSPDVKEGNNPLAESVASDDSGFGQYFTKRLVAMLKGNQLAKNLPTLLQDARTSLDELAADDITDPFHSIYRMVFQFTMRTVAANEIADDPELLEKCLKLYEVIEETGTPFSIMYPWMPVPAKFKRMYAGGKLYMVFKNVVDARNKEGRRENDALQYLMDQGDDIGSIITFVLGALFAGQLNSGINAAWILVYLASKPYWQDRVREEVDSVADRYCPDKTIPLKERLMRVPIEAWEGEFPLIDMCLKDSIRLQMSGTAFRKNTTARDIPIDKEGREVIPAGAFVSLAVGDMHYNPDFYADEREWDPSRYMSERAEDKKEQHAWIGWGVGRHPCLGMRFAKLENNLIVAFMLAYFEDLQPCDAKGTSLPRLPKVDRNSHTACKPKEHVYLKYKVRSG